MKKEKKKLEDDVATLTGQNTTLTTQNTTLAGENATLTTQNATLTAEKTALKIQNTTLAGENATLTTQNTTLAGENATLTTENTTLAGENTTLTDKNSKLELENDSYKKEVSSLKEEVSDFKIKKISDLQNIVGFIYKILNEKIVGKTIPIKDFTAEKAIFEYINNNLSFFINEIKYNAEGRAGVDLIDLVVDRNVNKISKLEFKDPKLNKIFDINKSLNEIKVEVENFEKLSNVKKQDEAFIASNPFNEIDTFEAGIFD